MHVSSGEKFMGIDESSAEAGGNDDDQPDLTLHRNSDARPDILSHLPSDGYQIFNEPPRFPPSFHGIASYRARWIVATSKKLARNWSNILMIFVPLGILAPHVGASHSAVFALNCVAIVPLADLLCHATDQISAYFGETTGALLNVTMGNSTEIVIFVHALMQRQYMIVRTSLLGSITVNILLVLGLAIFAGEIQKSGQTYNTLATRMTACLLTLSTISLLIPSALNIPFDDAKPAAAVLNFSRAISIVLAFVYAVYLSSQMKSSKYSYKPLIEADFDDARSPDCLHQMSMERLSHHSDRSDVWFMEPDAEAGFPTEPPRMEFKPWKPLARGSKLEISVALLRKGVPLFWLIVSTGLISLCAKYLVDSIDHFVEKGPLSKTTIGLIVLPIVGNAAEIVSAIMFASRRQMDLAFAVSIGSAIQIALFVTPLMVVIGWVVGRDMALHFSSFECITLIASTFIFCFLTLDDKCSSLKGALLCAGYAVIALGSNFYPNP